MNRYLALLVMFSLAHSVVDMRRVDACTSQEEDQLLFTLNFKSEEARLLPGGDIIDGAFKPARTEYGKIPTVRFEGSMSNGGRVGSESIELVDSFSPDTGRAIQYTLGPQGNNNKARAEHYLHVAGLNQTYRSEFSMMLSPDMTIAEEIRAHDDGENWVILRQWHQSVPESPPIALTLVPGTRNEIITSIRFGDHRRKQARRTLGRKGMDLGKWYHFRYQWRVAPGSDKGQVKVWISDTRWGDALNDDDVLFDYRGPVGYTLKGKPESEITKSSRSIREQQGLYQGPHRDASSFHSVTIGNVRVYRVAEQ